MQVNTGEITRLELELGEAVEILFCPKTENPQAILSILVDTREFRDGEKSLVITMPRGSTYKSDLTLSHPPVDYLAYLITGNHEEGRQFQTWVRLGGRYDNSPVV